MRKFTNCCKLTTRNLLKNTAKKSEKMPGAGEVFNEVEATLDEYDKALLATSPSIKKEKAKRRPLPAQ